jgi:hypothetical protein
LGTHKVEVVLSDGARSTLRRALLFQELAATRETATATKPQPPNVRDPVIKAEMKASVSYIVEKLEEMRISDSHEEKIVAEVRKWDENDGAYNQDSGYSGGARTSYQFLFELKMETYETDSFAMAARLQSRRQSHPCGHSGRWRAGGILARQAALPG